MDPGLRRDDDYRTTNFRSFARGRYALSAAYQLAGLTSGTTLLAPAYHCLTMLDPAIDLGADIRLYPLNPDLSPDLDRLDGVIDHSTSPVKALVATHFFGFRQDFKSLKNWCEQHGITLIEDGCMPCSPTITRLRASAQSAILSSRAHTSSFPVKMAASSMPTTQRS